MVDNTQLTYLINRDPILKFKYRGCFARDTFPILKHNEFVIVNTDPYSEAGEHWLLIASKNDTVLLYDSFGRDFSQFFWGYLQESSNLQQALVVKSFSVHANVNAIATFW